MPVTQTRRRQIVDGAIDDSKVGADAAIATVKLADGPKFLKNDGTVPLTGTFDAGNQRLTNVGTANQPGDAVPLAQLNAALAGLPSAYKYRTVRVASTTNINIANPGTSTFDGIALTSGDPLLGSILLPAQTNAAENGLYQFNGSGSPLTRLSNSDTWSEFPGSLVFVNEGTTKANTRWQCTSDDGGQLNTTPIIYSQDASNALTAMSFVDKEAPAGAINGANVTFTLANTPVSGSDHLYLNGHLQEIGAGNDYTLSGAVITMAVAPLAGEKIRVSYRK